MKNQNQGIKRSVSLTSKKQTPTRRRKGHFHKFLVVFHVILIVTLGRQIRRQLQLLGHQQYHQYDAVVREGEGGIQFKRSTLAKMRSESGSRQSSETGISNKFVDVLSISSLVRPELSQAQKETWASHHTVRNFMTVSEHDDPDPKCSSNFDTGKVNAYIQGCVKHNRDTNPSLKNYYLKSFFATHYAKYKWLAQKGDAGGWLCAQRRVAVGLAKIGRSYREREEELPEYLILADDDMYVNMDMFEESILLQSNNTVGEVQETGANRTAKVYAGCVIVAAPAHEHEFTFPWGGWGTFFNKGAIERLIMPLYCEDNHNKSPFEEWACGKLTGGGDFLGESSFFQGECQSVTSWEHLLTCRDTACIATGALDISSMSMPFRVYNGMALRPILVGIQILRGGIEYIHWEIRSLSSIKQEGSLLEETVNGMEILATRLVLFVTSLTMYKWNSCGRTDVQAELDHFFKLLVG